MQNIAAHDFDGTIAQGVVIVDFNASWCGPCKQLLPALETYAAAHPDQSVIGVDVDEASEVAQRYSVMSVPTVLVMRDANVLGRLVGARSATRLEAEIAEILAS